jgi:hypothetical protein
MLRQLRRFRVGIISAAILPVAGLVVTAMPTSAAQASSNAFELYNNFNGQCLVGREGSGGVTMATCGTQAQQYWNIDFEQQYEYQNNFNGQCLGGREGAGGVVMLTCGTEDQQEWQFVTYSSGTDAGYSEMQNLFNGECLVGREGAGGVTMATCDTQEQQEFQGLSS